jgi:adenine phosphoribosyltransferase
MELDADHVPAQEPLQRARDGRLNPVLEERVQRLVAIVPDFPIPGIKFRDISPILERDPALFQRLVDAMIQPHVGDPPDVVVCIESWGYLFGAPIAYELGSRIVLARQAGKLPRPTLGQNYTMGYAANRRMELHVGAIQTSDRVPLADDVLATGGTALAAVDLVSQIGAQIVGASFAVDIVELHRFPARRLLEARGVKLFAAARI